MPFAKINTVKGALNEDEKRILKEKITDALVEVEGGGNPDFRQHVWVVIDEIEGPNWSIGGMEPSAEMIQQMKQAHKAS